MPNYKLYDQDNQHVNTIIINDLSDWPLPSGHRLELVEELPKDASANKMISKLDFLLRFTMQERVNIRSSTDPMAQDFMNILDLSQQIDLEDANIVVAINYLETNGILEEGRAQQILS